MIASVWGEALSSTVAALIVERPHLGHRLALAQRRTVVWRLDRRARSLKQLLETVEDLDARKIGLLPVRNSFSY